MKFVRSVRLNFNEWSGWNLDGDRRYSGFNVNAHWTFVNNWTTGGGFNVNLNGFADRLTRGGPGGLASNNLNGWMYVSTDDRRPVRFGLDTFWLRSVNDSWSLEASPTITVRPMTSLSATVGVGFGRSVADSQWVANLTPEGAPAHYVFGRLDQTSLRVTTRAEYTMSPTLSLQVYAQPFVSAGDYGLFKELVDGRAPAYADRFAPFDYAGNPDFNVRSFRTTNVLRWEYRPGSALFVVWQQAREGFAPHGQFDFGRDFNGLFGAAATNVFLVKISRWINM